MSDMRASSQDRPVADAVSGAGRVKRIATAGIALGAVAVFSVGLWFAYDQGIKKGQKGAPMLIRAEQAPVKVAPTDPGGMQVPNQDKEIYNRLASNAPAGGEKVMPPPERAMPQDPAGGSTRPAAPANGVQSLPIPAAPKAPPPPPPARTVAAPPAPVAPPPPAVMSAASQLPPPASAEASPATLVPDAAQPPAAATATAPAPAPAAPPKALTPVRPTPAANTTANRATAAAPPPPAAPVRAGGGSVKVQVSAQRDQAAAQAAWTKVQKKLPDLFGGMTPTYERVDLGERGIYFRVQAGPYPDRAAAQTVCDRLKVASEGCIIVGR